jgi:hypothetical protein
MRSVYGTVREDLLEALARYSSSRGGVIIVEEGRCAEEPAPTSSRRSRQDVNTTKRLVKISCENTREHAY